jgi:putative heme iron utilization protein
MSEGTNYQTLAKAGLIEQGYDQFTDAEKAAIESLSPEELQALLSAKEKLRKGFSHAPIIMIY